MLASAQNDMDLTHVLQETTMEGKGDGPIADPSHLHALAEVMIHGILHGHFSCRSKSGSNKGADLTGQADQQAGYSIQTHVLPIVSFAKNLGDD